MGTILHEIGHIIPAKLLGYKTVLHYGSMNWYNIDQELIENRNHVLIILIGGPVQTMLTGSFGLLQLQRKTYIKISKNKNLYFWLSVFLSLFWSRQILNFSIDIAKYFQLHTLVSDEARISILLNFHPLSLGLITGILGIISCLFVVFKVIPKKIRLKFILSGVIGSTIGYYLWFKLIGPFLLP